MWSVSEVIFTITFDVRRLGLSSFDAPPTVSNQKPSRLREWSLCSFLTHRRCHRGKGSFRGVLRRLLGSTHQGPVAAVDRGGNGGHVHANGATCFLMQGHIIVDRQRPTGLWPHIRPTSQRL